MKYGRLIAFAAFTNLLVALLDLPPKLASAFRSFVTTTVFGAVQDDRFDGHRLAVVVDRDHREEARVGVSTTSFLDILGNDFHTDFQRRSTGEVDRCQKRDQFSDSNRLFEDDLVDTQRDDVVTAVSRGAGVSDFVQQFQHLAAVYVARKVRLVRRHQDGHRETFFALR